jgi:hypothetical protein
MMATILEIQYYAWPRFGIERFYPVSPDAVMVCDFMNTTELTDTAMRLLGLWGANLTEVIKPRN